MVVGRQLFTEEVTCTKRSSLLHGEREIKTTTLSEKFDMETCKKHMRVRLFRYT
jgi:hypothetical protein